MKAIKLYSSAQLDIFSSESESSLELPLIEEVRAGFPSPAMDFEDQTIDLNRYLIKHPAATFYGRVKGFSMKDEGIAEDDLLIIDKSLEPANGKIAVCFVDGEFTVKKIRIEKNTCYLDPANDKFEPIKITENNNFVIWGIVTHVIKTV
ncbi:MAG: translesion error-prone DNA polymerase V autoproteolytic subunit [Marinilabiliaceae bacterium]|nr:translesion error-prone DNA polymerase V autoproteolytic subunit [Marinilabiliaceae bacterium]